MATKTFPCGHKGKGQYCHRCEQTTAEQEKLKSARAEKQAWQEQFKHDPVDLSILPTRRLVEKARQIIADIASGAPYVNFKGKRMNFDRNVISVPLNHDFRLLYQQTEAGLTLTSVMSHEEYNIKKPGEKL
jgi:hypothetical protein